MGTMNLGKVTGTQLFSVTTAITTAPAGARIGDLLINGGTGSLTIGGKSLAVGDIAPIADVATLTLDAVTGNIRGVAGATGAPGSAGPAGITGATINANGELILTTP